MFTENWVEELGKAIREINLNEPINVSFVVIAYNESKGIADCISSILRQDVEVSKAEIEVLVIDDGSTDGTADLVEKRFSTQVKVIRQENAGRGFARLKGIENAKSPLIAMVDSDVRLPENWLTICLENLNSFAGVGGIALPDGDSTTIQRIFHLSPKPKRGSIPLMGSNALFRTDVLRDAGQNWLTPLGEDFRLNHILQQRGYKLKTIDNLLVRHIEFKTYRNSLVWLYKSGVDATRLWLEFRITRLPDIATILFLSSVVAIPILYPFIGQWCFLSPFLLILLVGLFHLVSKFHFRVNSLGFVGAWLPNSVLMLTYFLGRTSGILQIIKFIIVRKKKI
jgi:glycosyltransferase involved in cell wall biosynthesis